MQGGDRGDMDMLRQTKIPSIRQIIALRVLTTGLSALHYQKPKGVVDILSPKTTGMRTRASQRRVARVEEGQSDLVRRSFRCVFLRLYEKIPPDLKLGDPRMRKKELREWVIMNIPAMEDEDD